MKNPFCSLLILLIFSSTACDSSKTSNPPNIIIIMADDMGYSDAGFMGSEIHTPNLDALAGNGLLMVNFYNTGRCAPSRASLLTGLYSHQAGMGDMTRDDGYPSYMGHLNNNCVTIAQVLKASGYSTYALGKWHLGEEQENCWPLQRGFDRFYGHQEGWGIYFWPFIRNFIKVFEGNQPVEVDTTDFYYTDAITDKAIQYLEEHDQQKPFFMYLAHVAPHAPLQAFDEDIKKYRGKYNSGFGKIRDRRFESMKSSGILNSSTELSYADQLVNDWDGLSEEEKNEYDLRMAVYAAQIDRMDQGLGRIFNKIKEKGDWENTVIFFLSDNGGSTFIEPFEPEDYNAPAGKKRSSETYTPSWANVSNTPFRLYKKWTHEGGIATPLLIHYPNGIKKATLDYQTGHIIDLMPTCLDLAGVTYPETYNNQAITPVEGKSLLPIINGETREGHTYLYWEHEGNLAVRKGDYKAVKAFKDSAWSLYDLEKDRVEMYNLAEKEPQKLQDLEKAFIEWKEKVGVIDWEIIVNERKKQKQR